MHKSKQASSYAAQNPVFRRITLYSPSHLVNRTLSQLSLEAFSHAAINTRTVYVHK